MQDVFHYYAFISYKHEDKEYAKWLQKRLERYRLPATLQNEDIPRQAKPIFRDDTDLTPGQPLKDSIKEKLRLSKYLIVICSKNLAKESKYVNYEINSFVEMGRADRIIPIIIDGEPHAENPENECFCDALKQLPGEILAANSEKDGRYIASLKVIAALFQLDADDLIKRDDRRRKKNILLISLLTALLSILAVVALSTIFRLSFYSNSEEAIFAYGKKDYSVAAEYAMKALRVPGRKQEKQEVESILRSCVIANELKESNTHFHKDFEIEFANEGIALYGESKDGSKVAFSDLAKVWVYDFETGEKLAIFDYKTEKEALNEFLDPVQDTEKMVSNSKGEKKESEKYTQKAGDTTFFVFDENGKSVCTFDADKSAKWVYSQDDRFVVVYTGDEHQYIYVYSYEEDVCIQLENKYEGIRGLWLSDKGRYIFIEHSISNPITFDRTNYIDVYDTVSGCYITTLTSVYSVNIGDYFIFSDVDSEALYVFSVSSATKYVFEDVAPDFSNVYLTEKGTAVAKSGAGIQTVEISADGKRALNIQDKYIQRENYYDSESLTFMSIYDIQSGEPLIFTDIRKSGFALTRNFDICLVYKEKDVVIYDTDKASVLYEHSGYSKVTSVVLNEDGSYGAYSTENGNVYILERDGDGYRQKKELFASGFEGRTFVSAMKGDICVIYDETQSYMYSIEADEKEKFTDTNIIEVEQHSFYGDIRNAVTSEKFLEDKFLELNMYAGEYMFYDYETGERYEFDFLILPWNYTENGKLLVGIDYTGQMQLGSELKVVRLGKGEYEELYTYALSFPVNDVCFDNTGEYIILTGDNKSEVLEAETGKKILSVDRSIRIHDGIIYDVSSDLVLPDQLPVSSLGSLHSFKNRAESLK